MSETITKKAKDLEVGDLLHFPNSRHAAEINFTERTEDSITVESDNERTRWVLPLDRDVQVDVEPDE